MTQKAAVVVLDGWGIGRHDHSDAVWTANTPFTDSLNSNYPFTTLRTDGENVGLPNGQMGNSEVGHMNIGAGRIVWQMLVRINKSFDNNAIAENPVWNSLLEKCKNGAALHLMGLVSDGGVHSHFNHLIKLCKSAAEKGITKIYIHAFLDGRDTDPKSGKESIAFVQNEIKNTGAKFSTIIGRYYAMDRDKRWERVARAYNLITHGLGEISSNPVDEIELNYQKGITDEFMEPIRLLSGDEGLIRNGDVVLCFNFRTDRGRQITSALSQQDYPENGMEKLNLHYYTMTEYDETFKIDGVLFHHQNLNNTLGEVISNKGLTQLRAAETEKYPHVTFFFNGGREEPFPGEIRIMANSPKVATYDLKPEMSAFELTQKAVQTIEEKLPDFICLNYANPDMVGHTGVYNAIIKAVETVDKCLSELVATLQKNNYSILIIADHGNADFAVNDDGTPNTAHTTNPVPCWFITNQNYKQIQSGILADIAPTILKIMGIEQPAEMTGKTLI
jgi:2,3-bisphosphoglycerate-independent phosphoglycerate mutase